MDCILLRYLCCLLLKKRTVERIYFPALSTWVAANFNDSTW